MKINECVEAFGITKCKTFFIVSWRIWLSVPVNNKFKFFLFKQCYSFNETEYIFLYNYSANYDKFENLVDLFPINGNITLQHCLQYFTDEESLEEIKNSKIKDLNKEQYFFLNIFLQYIYGYRCFIIYEHTIHLTNELADILKILLSDSAIVFVTQGLSKNEAYANTIINITSHDISVDKYSEKENCDFQTIKNKRPRNKIKANWLTGVFTSLLTILIIASLIIFYTLLLLIVILSTHFRYILF